MRNKKIILVNTIPASLVGRTKSFNIPPGILSIGTWLTKYTDFEIKIIDCLIEKDYLRLVAEEIKDEKTFLIGLSVMSSCVPNAMEITRLVKQINSNIAIVWGGIHCKLYPKQTIAHPLIDFVVFGEGERTLENLANCLARGNSCSNVKGILYKKGKAIFINDPPEPIDLNEIGIMNYKLLNLKIFKEKIARIYTSRGCPHRCTFCINVITKNRKWRCLTPENVIREMEHLIDEYGIEIITFGDENFFVNKERADKIFDLIISRKIKVKLSAALRADYFTKGIVTPELLSKMKRCGFFNLGFGIEFGSQRMLDFIKKDITLEDALTTVKMLKKEDIGGSFIFMTGLPIETKEDTLATIQLIKKMYGLNKGLNVIKSNGKILSWRDKVRIDGPQVYRPYPGGELYEYIVKHYGWHTPESLEGWETYFKENTRYQIEEYPWLNGSPNFYAALQFYVKTGKNDFPTFFKKMFMPYGLKYKLMLLIFYPYAKIRMSLNFFNFPFEYMIGKRLGLLRELEF